VGARWVQTQILVQYPSAQLRVYAVWLPMLGSDRREAWNGTNMPDARVMHFWDGDLELGQWFAKAVDGHDGVAWDIYYLYGPEAVWETVPAPLLGSGRTIYAERQTLKMQAGKLLGE
jgi:hypothetical protein